MIKPLKIVSLIVAFLSVFLLYNDSVLADDQKRTETKIYFRGSGSGFFVSNTGLVVTNYHVVQRGNLFQILQPRTNTGVWVRLLAVDPENDLALLKADINSTPIPLALNFNLKIGDEASFIGFPVSPDASPEKQEIKQSTSFVRIISETKKINDINSIFDDRYVKVEHKALPGNSGGPLISPAGQVIGVITGWSIAISNQTTSRALKVENLYKIFNKAGIPMNSTQGNNSKTLAQHTSFYEDSVVRVMTYFLPK
jgi:S1-C subfamily serine protease